MPADTPTPLWGLWSDRDHDWFRSLCDACGFRSREEAEKFAKMPFRRALKYRPVLLVPSTNQEKET